MHGPFRIAVVGLALGAIALPRAWAAGPEDELKKLTADYQAAVQEYNTARQKGNAGRHPSIEFLAKFQDLAKKGRKSEAGAEADLWIIQNARFAGAEGQKALAGAVEDAVENHLPSPKMEAVAGALRYGAYSLPDRGESALRKIMNRSSVKEAKAAAMFTLATMICDDDSSDAKEKTEARELLESLAKDYPGTRYATQAKGYLFELDNLQIGKTAPDFTAKDQDDKTFKLSDYRGKVVVVDFWGFW
ncbi:MAG: redoxin domain-containing protein [Planctomycetes bacterium]|nr:redoxin domain-containing protein [Planctomycetota bacterium]